MIRALYASLILLHPPAFRREFGRELLWIFDEARLSEGAFILLFDLLISVGRQWLFRSGVWKFALAFAGAAAQVTIGGGGMLFISASHTQIPGPEVTPVMSDLIVLSLWVVGIVILMVFAVASWVVRFNRRRLVAVRRTA